MAFPRSLLVFLCCKTSKESALGSGLKRSWNWRLSLLFHIVLYIPHVMGSPLCLLPPSGSQIFFYRCFLFGVEHVWPGSSPEIPLRLLRFRVCTRIASSEEIPFWLASFSLILVDISGSSLARLWHCVGRGKCQTRYKPLFFLISTPLTPLHTPLTQLHGEKRMPN